MNFFGYGRTATALSGITPGSVAIQFYTKGYQGLGLSDVTSNTPTGLTASTTYYLTIAADGGSALEINFTTDATNGNFGGANGLISKIQDALDTAYYTAGNLFEKKVNVFIRGGDVIFESQSKLSTSAIALTAGTSGSGASATANGSGAVTGGDLTRFSGDILYVENRSPVTRAADQIEDVKLIIEF